MNVSEAGVSDVPWTLTADAHAAFLTVSGDRNPLHADPVAARRLLGGRMLAHGAHLLLAGLEQAVGHGTLTAIPHRITVTFRSGVAPGDALATSLSVDAAHTASRITITAMPSATTVATIEAAVAPAPAPTGPFHAPACSGDVPTEPRALSIDDLAGMIGGDQPTFTPAHDPAAIGVLFPRLAVELGTARLAEIAAISCVVGMLSPGRSSMSSSYSIDLVDPDEATPLVIGHRVVQVDPRLRRVSLAVTGPTIRADVVAFSPPSPVDQRQVLAAARARPHPGEFAGWRALVVGGSRGLGEMAARLLVVGGADVRLTWGIGEHDARRVASDLGCAAMQWCAPSDGAAGLLAGDPDWQPTHLCWFASPPTGHAHAHAVEIEAFDRAARALPVPPLVGVLWPSTAALDGDAGADAATCARKRAGEAVCERLAGDRPGVVVHVARFPTLLTDRTVSLLPREYGDTAREVLAALRGTAR